MRRTHGALVTIELPGSEVFVTGSASRLQQMWLNLLNNAFDAVTTRKPEKGSIVISVEHLKKEGLPTAEGLSAGQEGYAEVTITDLFLRNRCSLTSEPT